MTNKTEDSARSPAAPPDISGRVLLRHALATLAYRGGKALRDAPPEFASFRAAPGSRTPGEILSHIGDLLDWAGWLARGENRWRTSKPGEWSSDVGRFFGGLEALDAFLASDAPLQTPAQQLFQGPIADSISHVGQLAMLRRLAGAPIRGENYVKAEISLGRVGADQAAPQFEFD